MVCFPPQASDHADVTMPGAGDSCWLAVAGDHGVGVARGIEQEMSIMTRYSAHRAHRRHTIGALGASGLALLAGRATNPAPEVAAARKQRAKRRKKRRQGGGGRGAGDPLSVQKVEGTPFTVGDGQSADGLADCPNAGLAIGGGLTQSNAACFLAQSNQVDEELWGITVTCPEGAGATEVTPFVMCLMTPG